MTDLRQAAQAVLDRWDSPRWEWDKQGPTAELMAALRTALEQEPEPAHGDIRALKYRIHELEGEVLGYKRMLEEAALKKLADLGQEIEQEPVAWPVEEQPDGSVIPVDPADMTAAQALECKNKYSLWREQRYGITTTPAARRSWVGLTDKEIKEIAFNTRYGGLVETTRAIEAKLKERNT